MFTLKPLLKFTVLLVIYTRTFSQKDEWISWIALYNSSCSSHWLKMQAWIWLLPFCEVLRHFYYYCIISPSPLNCEHSVYFQALESCASLYCLFCCTLQKVLRDCLIKWFIHILSLFCSCSSVHHYLHLYLKDIIANTITTCNFFHQLFRLVVCLCTRNIELNMNTKNVLAWPLNCCTDTSESRMEKEENWSVYWMEVLYNTVLLNWLWIILYTGIVFVNKLVWIFSLMFMDQLLLCVHYSEWENIGAHCSTWIYSLIYSNNTSVTNKKLH